MQNLKVHVQDYTFLECIKLLFAASPVNIVHHNATTMDRGKILLNCKMTIKSGPVTWSRPHDHMPISSDYDVIDVLRRKFQVVGDPREGEYHLLITQASYPEDHGNWTCSNFAGGQQVSNLLVLVAPASSMPAVTPSNVSVIDLTSEAWTFTCSSHFAFPPVDLKWVKVMGPDLPYDVTPPSMVISDRQTMVSSIRLVVSALHAGSVFACQARHPAFRGQVYSEEIHFAVPYSLESRALGKILGVHMTWLPRSQKGTLRTKCSNTFL